MGTLRIPARVAALASVVGLLLVPMTPAGAAEGDSIGQALDASVAVTVLASYPDESAISVRTDSRAGFPTSGDSYIVASTGRADDIARPNTESSWGTAFSGGPGGHGDAVGDLSVIQVSFTVPQSANCLVGLDFRFLSEEFPEYVGSSFNDVFLVELDRSTWTATGSSIDAPDNIAFDASGSVISVNSAGVTSMTAGEAEGTTFDGATPLLRASTPITPGPHSIFISVADLGDRYFDSSVMIDNLDLGKTRPGDCVAGVTVGGETTRPGRTEYIEAGGILNGMIVCPPGEGYTLKLTGGPSVAGIGSRDSNSNPYYVIGYSSKTGRSPYEVEIIGTFGPHHIDYELRCTSGHVATGAISVGGLKYVLIPGTKSYDPMVLEVSGVTHRNICAGLPIWRKCS